MTMIAAPVSLKTANLVVNGEIWDKKLYDKMLGEIESYIDIEKEYYTVKGFVEN